MNTETLYKKALIEYQKGEKEFKKTCCSSKSYDMAIISYKTAFTLYKTLKENSKVIEISDKIIFCNEKMKNYIGIAIQYENVTNYLTMFAPTYFTEICKYFELGYKSYLEKNDINKSGNQLIKYLKYLDKIKYDNKCKYLVIIKKTIEITDLFEEDKYIYKIDILKMLFPYIIKYFNKKEANDYMENMIYIFRKLNQSHNIYTIMLSNILYFISNYDFDEAKKTLNKYYQFDNFILTEECEIARKMLFLCEDDKVNMKKELDILLKNNNLHMVIREIYNRIKNINLDKIIELQENKIYRDFDIL